MSNTAVSFEKLTRKSSRCPSESTILPALNLAPSGKRSGACKGSLLPIIWRPITPEKVDQESPVMTTRPATATFPTRDSVDFLLHPHELGDKDKYLFVKEHSPNALFVNSPLVPHVHPNQEKLQKVTLQSRTTVRKSQGWKDEFTTPTPAAIVTKPPPLKFKCSTGVNLSSSSFARDGTPFHGECNGFVTSPPVLRKAVNCDSKVQSDNDDVCCWKPRLFLARTSSAVQSMPSGFEPFVHTLDDDDTWA